MTRKPVTITLDAEQQKRIRTIQAQLIHQTVDNWSFSQVVGLLLNDAIKSFSISKAKKISR